MRILFMVGNGFDIGCGIQSSYREFYNWYCTTESEKEHIAKFKKEIANNGEYWSDFEYGLGQYTAKFSKDAIQDFIDCYEDAHERLIEYLEKESNRFDYKLTEEQISSLRKGLQCFYYELSPREQNTFNTLFNADKMNNSIIKFASFNYTDALDKCIEQISEQPLKTWKHNGVNYTLSIDKSVIHVHGTLSEFPIFGVNDPTQIANEDFLSDPRFRSIMIKPESVKAIGHLWHDELNKQIQDSKIICIFGMSIGFTDSAWFKKVMNWLQSDGSRQLIIYRYLKNPSNRKSILLHVSHVQEARKLITDYSDFTEEQIDDLNNRIHIVENTKDVLQVKLKEKE